MSSTLQARPPAARPGQQALQARQAREAGRKALAARQWAKAVTHLERAAELQPSEPLAWLDLIELGLSMGEPARAELATRRLLALAPGHAQAHRLLLRCLELQGDWLGLIAAIEQLPPEIPRDADILDKHGSALFRAHRPQDAIQVFIETLRQQPRHAGTHYRLGLALKLMEMDAQSAISFETASLLDPEGKAGFGGLSQSLLVHQLARLVRWKELGAQSAALLKRLDATAEAIPPFALLALPASRLQHLNAGRQEGRRLTLGLGTARLPAPVPRKAEGRRLRLGLLSSDFFNHATVTLLVELLELMDRRRFEIFLYCHSRNDGSAKQQRIRAAADHFRDINNISDVDAARLMRSDGIDIAIDLKGYTENSRMQILGLRPAPLQISYLGYPGTSGVDFLDYVIGDPVVTPLAHADGYSERIAQMPHSYQPNDRARAPLPTGITRASQGLPEDAPVLCCFNQSYKITPEMADLWAQILHGSPRAVLWLLAWNDTARKGLLAEMATRGVAAQRLIFSARVGSDANVARLQCADLFLDTWPCNAHTTASDALWAGVPVLTVPGETFASRVAASLVRASALPAFVCDSPAAYVAKAIALLQGERTELHAAQAHLREQRLSLPLFDTERYTRDFEALLARAWARCEAGLAPEHLAAEVSMPAA